MVIKYIFAKKTGNVSVQKRKEEEEKKQSLWCSFPIWWNKVREISPPTPPKPRISTPAQRLVAAVSGPEQGVVPWVRGTRCQPCVRRLGRLWHLPGQLNRDGAIEQTGLLSHHGSFKYVTQRSER